VQRGPPGWFTSEKVKRSSGRHGAAGGWGSKRFLPIKSWAKKKRGLGEGGCEKGGYGIRAVGGAVYEGKSRSRKSPRHEGKKWAPAGAKRKRGSLKKWDSKGKKNGG